LLELSEISLEKIFAFSFLFKQVYICPDNFISPGSGLNEPGKKSRFAAS
jgi:hypothetical protein